MENQWALESASANGAGEQFLITRLPCQIGRAKQNDLVFANLGLSRVHATLTYDITGRLRLVDENSTNGTYVNRLRVEGYHLLKENDIIHLGSAEFRLRRVAVDEPDALPFDQMHTLIIPVGNELSEHFSSSETEFEELIMGQGLSGAIQPIVDAHTRKIVGYELLGRANHPQLPQTPIELFSLAVTMGREVDLSFALREFGVNNFASYIQERHLFINAHPKEMFSDSFIASLEQLRRSMPRLQIVVEIHESAITNIDRLRHFARQLAAIGIRFAYDDFGAGQARLLELADVPAHFVKFDKSLISELHKAGPRKQQVVRNLVQTVLAAGSIPLAEGVESEEEAQACIAMGIQLIQGFLTGRPIRVEDL